MHACRSTLEDPTDNLPAGLVVATPPNVTGTFGGGTVTATAGSSTISFSGASLAAGASLSFSVNVTSTTAGVKSNSVTVGSNEGGNSAAAAASVTVVAPPSLGTAFGLTNLPLGGSTTLTFTITNPNPGTALTGVAFTDNLPGGLVVATPNGLTGNSGGGKVTADAGAGVIGLAGAIVPSGGSISFMISVTATSSGTKNNSVTVTSANGGTGNTSNASLTVGAAAPTVSGSFGAPSIPLGGSTSLTFTITNPNGTAALNGLSFTDSLPAGLVVSNPNGFTLVSGSLGSGTVTATAGSGTISLSGASLAAGSSVTFRVNVTGATAGTKNNSVTVSSTEGGAGNTSNASLTVVAPPTSGLSFGAASIALNGSTSLTFTITNPNAGLALTGLSFTDSLPSGLVVSTPNGFTLVSGSLGGGTVTATAGSGTITLSGGSLAANSSVTFRVNVTGTTPGTKNNSVTINSTEAGAGNTSNASLTVVAPPTSGLSFGAPSIALNGTTSLTFTVTNPNGSTTLTGLSFTDALPAGLVVATPNGLSNPSPGGGTVTATPGSGTITLSGAALAPNASFSFSVNVTGTTPGVKNNSVMVSSAQGGSSAAAGASVTVVAAPPTVTARQVNDGSAQRSRVIGLKVFFSGLVSLPADRPEQAFVLTDNSGNAVPDVTLGATVDNSSGATVATITFGGTAVVGASLADGRYVLKTLASQVTDSAGQHLAADDAFSFFRFFGDANGDARVDNLDFALLKTAFNTQAGDPNYLFYFDYDGSGKIDNLDLAQFKTRLLQGILP